MDPKTKPVFIHLKKTAGTSIKQLMVEIYGESRILLSQDPYTDGTLVQRRIENEMGHPKNFFHRYDAFAGHFPFHAFLDHDIEFFFFSVVRHPVLKRISDWNYIRRTPEHVFHAIAMTMTFMDFLEFDNQRNLQCKAFGGETFNGVRHILETNVKQRIVIGTHENVQAMMHAIGRLLAWPKSNLPRENAHQGEQYHCTIAEAARILELDAQDVLFYRWLTSVKPFFTSRVSLI